MLRPNRSGIVFRPEAHVCRLPVLIVLSAISYTHAQQLYYRAGDRQIILQEAPDIIAARVLPNAVVAQSRREFELYFGSAKNVGIKTEELLLQDLKAETATAETAIRN